MRACAARCLVEEAVSRGGEAGGEHTIAVLKRGGSAVSSRASIKFTVGAPEITPPHRREVRMTYSRFLPPNGGDGWGSVTRRKGVGRTKLVVVIEGDVPIADGLAMKIPEYVPFLILRRPPGGASAAAISSGFGSSYSMDVSV